MKTVDTHAHAFSAAGSIVSGARYQPSNDAPISTFISELDQHGFNYGVLIQPSFLGYDNTYILDSIRKYPDRLKGVAVLPLEVDRHVLKELDEGGIVGARLNLFGKAIPDLRSSEWQHFLQLIGERGWQLELHCPPSYLVQMLPQLQDFQGPVVLDHFGRVDPEKGTDDPDYVRIIDLLVPDRHWVKLSGFYRLGESETGKRHAHESLQMLLAKGMEDRLVWGSDWPHTQHDTYMSYDQALTFMDTLLPDEKLREKVLSHNPLRLFEFIQ